MAAAAADPHPPPPPGGAAGAGRSYWEAIADTIKELWAVGELTNLQAVTLTTLAAEGNSLLGDTVNAFSAPDEVEERARPLPRRALTATHSPHEPARSFFLNIVTLRPSHIFSLCEKTICT